MKSAILAITAISLWSIIIVGAAFILWAGL